MDKIKINNLITKIGEGDEDAMTELYEGIKKQVYSFIFGYVKNNEKTEDLMQDTFIKLFQTPKVFTEKDNGFAYVLTIARNLTLNHIKREKKMVSVTSEEIEVFGGSYDEKNSARVELKEFLQTLTREERQILILKEIYGFTFEEIQKIMKLGLATCKRRMEKVRAKFKNYDTKSKL